MCQVIGYRQFSQDLLQGGLEIPCIYVFIGEAEHIEKVKKTIEKIGANVAVKDDEKSDVESIIVESEDHPTKEQLEPEAKPVMSNDVSWISVDNVELTYADKQIILDNEELNDMHIFICQRLLHKQFPTVMGLDVTLKVREMAQ